jgi:hypothetical protein
MFSTRYTNISFTALKGILTPEALVISLIMAKASDGLKETNFFDIYVSDVGLFNEYTNASRINRERYIPNSVIAVDLKSNHRLHQLCC